MDEQLASAHRITMYYHWAFFLWISPMKNRGTTWFPVLKLTFGKNEARGRGISCFGHINYSILISLDSSKSSILIIYIYIFYRSHFDSSHVASRGALHCSCHAPWAPRQMLMLPQDQETQAVDVDVDVFLAELENEAQWQRCGCDGPL